MSVEITTDLNSQIYHDALVIRRDVFIKEEHVPEDREIDENENKTIYFVDYEANIPVGTARLLPLPEEDHNLIQRVAVQKKYRHQHIGAKLIQTIIKYQQVHYPNVALQLGAQLHAIPFYETLGFKIMPEIDPYMDAGIKHREMRYIKN